MSSLLSRLTATKSAPSQERRRASRTLVEIEALVASVRGQSSRMGIGDISAHGCSLSSDADWLRIGGFLSISAGTRPPLEGVIRWLRDGKAGVEFLRPVPAAYREWHELIDSFGTSS